MALLRPVLHRLSCSNETVRDAQNMSFGSNGVDWVRSLRKRPMELHLANLCVIAPVRPALQRLSCCNETVRYARKHEFWVPWSGSHAFIAKKANASLFSELER
jgi:hypothetical protein